MDVNIVYLCKFVGLCLAHLSKFVGLYLAEQKWVKIVALTFEPSEDGGGNVDGVGGVPIFAGG